MKVNNIQNQTNFTSFSLSKNAAWSLAGEFVNNPKFEEKFFKEIVAPVEKSLTELKFDGYSACFKRFGEQHYNSVIHSTSGEYFTMPLSGPSAYQKRIFKPEDMEYTKSFKAFPYSILEAGKNIVAYLDRKNPNAQAEKLAGNYQIPTLGDTFIEKFKTLSKLFVK